MPSSAPSSRRLRVKVAKPIRDYRTRPLMRLLDCSSANYFKLTSYVYSSRRLGRPKYLSLGAQNTEEDVPPAPYTMGTLLLTPRHLIGHMTNQNLANHYLLRHESADAASRNIERCCESKNRFEDLYKRRRWRDSHEIKQNVIYEYLHSIEIGWYMRLLFIYIHIPSVYLFIHHKILLSQ